jgi:hypothetical protein
MSYTEKKQSIRLDIYAQIDKYKNGTKKEQEIVEKIEKLANETFCFQCLDTKQSWYFRGRQFMNDGKGDYYKMTCAVCSHPEISDKWIEDCNTCVLYGASGIQLFNKENYSGLERFKELEKRVLFIHPELNEEEPSYKKTERNNISIKKKTYNLKLEVGNIIQKCQEIVGSYCGDISSMVSLLNNIKIHISNCQYTGIQEHILCEEIDSKNFMYIKIENNSVTKKKSILGLFEYNKYKLDIDIHFYVFKPDNEPAYNKCKEIINKLAMSDILDANELFLSMVHK